MHRSAILLTAMLFLVSCMPSAATPPPGPPPSATPRPEPTLTPTPVTPLVMLSVPPEMNTDDSNAYQTAVYDLAQADGYRFQVRNGLTPADLAEPGLAIVVVLPPDPGVEALAASAPQVDFLSVNIAGIMPASNLTVIGSADRPDYPAFIAGYISAMISEDWHVGLLTEKESTAGQQARTAFENGVTFYCGLCNPVFPPYYDYPIEMEIPADARSNELTGYADFLINRLVQTVYVYPTYQQPDLLFYLGSYGVQMIGTQTPTDPSILPFWVATIQPNYIAAIQQAWPALAAGEEGRFLPSPLALTHVNPDLLSPGKQRLAEEMLQKLLAGLIDTGVSP